MRAGHSLDWLHGLLSATRWVCVRKERPREWELAICFRFIPRKGPSHVDALAIAYREPDGSLEERRRDTRANFAKAREFLHAKILRASSTGSVEGRFFKALVPVHVHSDRKLDWLNDVDLLDPDERGFWTIRDKETLAVIQFRMPDAATASQKRAILEAAMNRMLALRSRIARVHQHAKVAGRVSQAH